MQKEMARLREAVEARQGHVTQIAGALRNQRDQVARRMESGVNAWFAGLADRVISRALRQPETAGRGNGHLQTKRLPSAEMLLPGTPWLFRRAHCPTEYRHRVVGSRISTR